MRVVNTEKVSPMMLPPGSLLRLAKRYFPVTLTDLISPICPGCLENQCKDEDMEDHAEQVLDKLHQELEMFESPPAKLTALQTCQAFTTSHWFFNKDICESYNRIFQEHKSLKKETYIQKNTLFALLQDTVLKAFPAMQNPLPRALLALFLKTHEKKLLGTLEFIKWSDDETRRMQSSFIKELEDSMRNNRYVSQTDLELICSLVFNALGTVISQNPTCFLRDSETPHVKKPKIVRIFVDHGYKFVMRAEMVGIQECHENEYLATIDAKLALKLALEHTAKGGEPVEFIPTDITRIKDRAVPIQTPNGKLCKSAVDVLFELLHDLIFGYRVFQDTSEFYWSQVAEFLDGMNEYFPSEKKDPYFLDMETIEKIDQMAREKFSTDFPAPADELNWKTKREQHRIATQHIDRRLWRNTSIEKRFLDSPVAGKLSDVIGEDILYFCHIEFPNLTQFIHNQDGCWRFLRKKCCGVLAPAPKPAPRDALDNLKAPLRGKPDKQYLKSLDKWIDDMNDKLGWVEDVKPIPKTVNVHEKVLYKPRIESQSVKSYRMRVTMKKRAARAKAPKLNLPSPPQEPLPSIWCRIYLPEKSLVNLDGSEEVGVLIRDLQSDWKEKRMEHWNVQEEMKQAKRQIEKMRAEKEEQQKIQLEKDRKTAMVHRTVQETQEQLKVVVTTVTQEKEQLREQLVKEQRTRKEPEIVSKKYQDHLAAIEKNIEIIQNNPLIAYSQLARDFVVACQDSRRRIRGGGPCEDDESDEKHDQETEELAPQDVSDLLQVFLRKLGFPGSDARDEPPIKQKRNLNTRPKRCGKLEKPESADVRQAGSSRTSTTTAKTLETNNDFTACWVSRRWPKDLKTPENTHYRPTLFSNFLLIDSAWMCTTSMVHWVNRRSHINRSCKLIDPFYTARTDAAKTILEYLEQPDVKIVLAPYCSGKHWTLMTVSKSRVDFYDPLKGAPCRHVQHIIDGLGIREVKHLDGKEYPRQRDGHSCGVFVALQILAVISGQPWTPRQASYDIKLFKRRFLAEMQLDFIVVPEPANNEQKSNGAEPGDDSDVIWMEEAEDVEDEDKSDDKLEIQRRSSQEAVIENMELAKVESPGVKVTGDQNEGTDPMITTDDVDSTRESAPPPQKLMDGIDVQLAEDESTGVKATGEQYEETAPMITTDDVDSTRESADPPQKLMDGIDVQLAEDESTGVKATGEQYEETAPMITTDEVDFTRESADPPLKRPLSDRTTPAAKRAKTQTTFVLVGVRAAKDSPTDMADIIKVLQSIGAPEMQIADLKQSEPMAAKLNEDGAYFPAFKFCNTLAQSGLADWLQNQLPTKTTSGHYVQMLDYSDQFEYAIKLFLFLVFQSISDAVRRDFEKTFTGECDSKALVNLCNTAPAESDAAYRMLAKKARRAVRIAAAAGGKQPSSWSKAEKNNEDKQ